MTLDQIAAARAADPTTDGGHQALRAEASRADAAAKASAWDRILHDDGLAASELWALAGGFWQPEQAELTAPYVARFFAEYPATITERSPWVAGDLTAHLFPKFAVSADTIANADDLLHHGDLRPAVARAIETGATDLRRALSARDAYPQECGLEDALREG